MKIVKRIDSTSFTALVIKLALLWRVWCLRELFGKNEIYFDYNLRKRKFYIKRPQ